LPQLLNISANHRFVGLVKADFPLADFPHHNEGQSLSQALACLKIFCSSPKCGGLVLTEVNPDHDVDGSMVSTFTQLLVKALTEAASF